MLLQWNYFLFSNVNVNGRRQYDGKGTSPIHLFQCLSVSSDRTRIIRNNTKIFDYTTKKIFPSHNWICHDDCDLLLTIDWFAQRLDTMNQSSSFVPEWQYWLLIGNNMPQISVIWYELVSIHIIGTMFHFYFMLKPPL